MAYRIKKKRSYKKKRTFSKRTGGAQYGGVKRARFNKPKRQVNMGLGFPSRVTQRHKYVETVYVTSNSGTFGTYQFAANGMFDPNLTGTGHQPLYFDQMSALYDHYTVIGAKCKFTFVPDTSPAAAGRAAAFINDDSSVTATVIEDIAEQSNGNRIVVMAPGNDYPRSLTLKWSAKKFFPGSTMSNNELKGTATTNPSELSHFVIGFQADQTGSQKYAITTEIEYVAVWTELKDVARS